MNKKNFIIIITMIVFVFALSMGMEGRTKAAFKQCTKTKNVKYDLNGDGKTEKIQFKFNRTEYEDRFRISIVINGNTKIGTIKQHCYGEGYDYFEKEFLGLDYDFIKLKNGKRFLYVHPYAENYDGPNYIYQYKSGKLKKVCNMDKYCRWVDSIKVQGNSIRVKMSDSGGKIGANSFWVKYNFKQNRFVIDSKIFKIHSYVVSREYDYNNGGIIPLEVLRPFSIYSDKNCENYAGTVNTGEYVKAIKVYKSEKTISYYIVNDRIQGWISGDDIDYSDPCLENEGSGVA